MATSKKGTNTTSGIKKNKTLKIHDVYFKINFIENLPVLALSLILAGFCFALYYQILNFGLIRFDDDLFINKYVGFIKNNISFNQAINDTFGATFYRPVLTLSFLMDASVWGTDPTGYHLTNILIHLFSSLLLFVTLYKLKFSKSLSFIFTLFFISQPILTPSVAWISGRNDSLLALFTITSFIMLIMATEKKDKLNYFYLALHLIFFFIAALTKESGIVFFVIFYLFFVFIKGEKAFSGRILQLAGGWFLVILLFFILRSSSPIYYTKLDIYGLPAVLLNISSLPAIIGKIFLPLKMSGCSQYDIFSISTGIFFSLVLIILPLIIRKKINLKFYYFGLIWFCLALIPTFFVKVHSTNYDYLEHRSYLPLIGLLFTLVAILKSFNLDFNKNLAKIIFLTILVAFSIRTVVYSATFSNPVDFWSNNIKQYPENFQGYLSLGRYYFNSDSLKKSEYLFGKALEYGNGNYGVYQALSALEINKTNFKKAEEYARTSISLNNENEYAYSALSAACIGVGKYQEAIDAAKKGLQYDKDKKVSDLNINLGLAYYITKKYQESIDALNKGLAINPKFARGYGTLGAAYYAIGDVANSIKSFYIAIEKNPMSKEANNNLIKILLQKDPKKAFEVADSFRKRGGKLEPAVEQMLVR